MPSTHARLDWVDHLRTFIIILVVSAHACAACSHLINWYYVIEPGPRPATEIVFTMWLAHMQALTMVPMFLLAGYFADRSLARRGPRAFLAERALRLGVPTLIFMLVIHPFIVYGLNPWHSALIPFRHYYRIYLTSGNFLVSTGPLWFTLTLLIFCVYLLIERRIRPAGTRNPVPSGRGGALRMASVLGLGVALGLASFLIRIWLPIGSFFLGFAMCFSTQYLVMFCLGVVVSRRNALQALVRSPVTRQALLLGIPGGPLLLGLVIAVGGPPPAVGFNPYFGGLSWHALIYALWEQITGVCIGLGLLSWFSQHLNRDTPLLRWMADRSFGVYVFHTPILVAFTMLLEHVHTIRFVLAALIMIATLVASYLFTDVIRRLPGLRTIF